MYKKDKARKQIQKLLVLDGACGFMIAGASWVTLLAARGFTTIEIGLAESIFHTASMLFEIPSGAIADVFGRKKVLFASRIAAILSSLLMILSDSFFMIGIAMVISALSYNLASGTREALAYDTLKQADIEKEYNRFAANDMVIYQISSSLATLLAGVALMLGYRRAYLVDILLGILSLLIIRSMYEASVGKTCSQTLPEEENASSEKKTFSRRFVEVAKESASFLYNSPKARWIIALNSVSGAVSILILFFLQAKLPQLHLPRLWLGPALFFMGLGSALGAKVAEALASCHLRRILLFSFPGVALAFGSVFTKDYRLMIAGGFIGAFADNLFCVRSDVTLNHMIPSEQRATLVSVNSFSFSVVMILLSPVFGLIFS